MTKRLLDVRGARPWLDIASFGRRGPGRSDRLSHSEIEQIARTVRRVPEVMVKVSGGGTSAKAVAAHLKYIDRRGELEIETDGGDRLQGKGVEKALLDDWDLDLDASGSQFAYSGTPGRKPMKLVHNVILSMPAGTLPDKLLEASRVFAREQFALKHRYAMVLHTDQDHPHVHLVIKAMSEQGARLNIRKATLREWRREFARHLRDHGIAANATDRAVRGQTKLRKLDGIYRATQRGESTHMCEHVREATAFLSGDVRNETGKSRLLQTREVVEFGWRAVIGILVKEGYRDLAQQVNWFVDRMPPPRTEREQLADELRKHWSVNRTRIGEQEVTRESR